MTEKRKLCSSGSDIKQMNSEREKIKMMTEDFLKNGGEIKIIPNCLGAGFSPRFTDGMRQIKK